MKFRGDLFLKSSEEPLEVIKEEVGLTIECVIVMGNKECRYHWNSKSGKAPHASKSGVVGGS